MRIVGETCLWAADGAPAAIASCVGADYVVLFMAPGAVGEGLRLANSLFKSKKCLFCCCEVAVAGYYFGQDCSCLALYCVSIFCATACL